MHRRTLLSVLLLAAAAILCGFSCKRGGSLRNAAPPGATATIDVTLLANGSPDSEALFARRVLWTYVPSAWLPASERLVIRSAMPSDIATAVAADRYAGPGFGGTFTNDGFTSISGNDTRAPTGPTVIYLSHSMWDNQNATGEVILHEFAGHVHYWHALTDTQRTEWTREWDAARTRRALPTPYAATNEYEGYAECAAYYLVGKLKDPILLAWFKALPQ